MRALTSVRIVLLCLAGTVTFPSQAVDIVVVALFKNKVVANIDGNRRVLTIGEISPEGAKLISSNSDEAIIELNGARESYGLGAHIGTTFTPAQSREVQIFADSSGMYTVTGSINGHLTNFLVDTGATHIAMNADHAQRLGIDFRYTGVKHTVETASGVELAYGITLKSVKVGEIELRDVQASVLDGKHPSDVLLGMSFLGRLDMQRSGQALTLRRKF